MFTLSVDTDILNLIDTLHAEHSILQIICTDKVFKSLPHIAALTINIVEGFIDSYLIFKRFNSLSTLQRIVEIPHRLFITTCQIINFRNADTRLKNMPFIF